MVFLTVGQCVQAGRCNARHHDISHTEASTGKTDTGSIRELNIMNAAQEVEKRRE